MKFLKYFMLVLVALVAIALVYGAILPNKATVTQTVSTKADPQRVFYLINDLKIGLLGLNGAKPTPKPNTPSRRTPEEKAPGWPGKEKKLEKESYL